MPIFWPNDTYVVSGDEPFYLSTIDALPNLTYGEVAQISSTVDLFTKAAAVSIGGAFALGAAATTVGLASSAPALLPAIFSLQRLAACAGQLIPRAQMSATHQAVSSSLRWALEGPDVLGATFVVFQTGDTTRSAWVLIRWRLAAATLGWPQWLRAPPPAPPPSPSMPPDECGDVPGPSTANASNASNASGIGNTTSGCRRRLEPGEEGLVVEEEGVGEVEVEEQAAEEEAIHEVMGIPEELFTLLSMVSLLILGLMVLVPVQLVITQLWRDVVNYRYYKHMRSVAPSPGTTFGRQMALSPPPSASKRPRGPKFTPLPSLFIWPNLPFFVMCSLVTGLSRSATALMVTTLLYPPEDAGMYGACIACSAIVLGWVLVFFLMLLAHLVLVRHKRARLHSSSSNLST